MEREPDSARNSIKPVSPHPTRGTGESFAVCKDQPIILNVGPKMLYLQAHIPGAEYIGPGSDPESIKQLHARAQALSHTALVVLYCGCCPWSHCPNVAPAYSELQRMGFTNIKVLYIADNLGTDWVYKGYPTVRATN